jgi:hypothetical protein
MARILFVPGSLTGMSSNSLLLLFLIAKSSEESRLVNRFFSHLHFRTNYVGGPSRVRGRKTRKPFVQAVADLLGLQGTSLEQGHILFEGAENFLYHDPRIERQKKEK